MARVGLVTWYNANEWTLTAGPAAEPLKKGTRRNVKTPTEKIFPSEFLANNVSVAQVTGATQDGNFHDTSPPEGCGQIPAGTLCDIKLRCGNGPDYKGELAACQAGVIDSRTPPAYDWVRHR